MTRFSSLTAVFVATIFLIAVVAHGQATKQTKQCFDKNKPFEILNSKKGITDQSSDKDTTICKNWTIPQTIIPSIIKDSKVITGTEWHDYFSVYRCIIYGQLYQNGQTYKYEINGGSWMFIFCNGQAIILGDYKKEHEKYFLSNAWDGNE